MHPHGNPVGLTVPDPIRDLKSERNKRQTVFSQLLPVQPDLRTRMRPAKSEPKACTMMDFRQDEGMLIPSGSLIGGPEDTAAQFEVPHFIFGIRTKSLPLPRSGHLDGIPSAPPFLEPFFGHSTVIGIQTKRPSRPQ